MEKSNEKIVSVVSELAQFVKDGKVGYKKAADETKNAKLKTFCMAESEMRAEFLNALNAVITRNGGDPEKCDTVKGKLYHAWMDIKAAFTNRDEDAIIGSCIYGEEWALKAYDDALGHDELPSDVRMMMEKQRETCHTAYVGLKKMKDEFAFQK